MPDSTPTDLKFLQLLYQQSGPFLYGAVQTIDGTPDTQRTSQPFVISQRVGHTEIVYGSIQYQLQILDRLLTWTERDQSTEVQWLKDQGITFTEEVQSGGVAMVTVEENASPQVQSFLEEQDDALKDNILLLSIYARNLLETFGGKFTASIDLYDTHGNTIGDIPLTTLTSVLIHHRYCVLIGRFMMDVFSGDSQMYDDELIGSKFDIIDFIGAIRSVVASVRWRDLLGLLRNRLHNLSPSSSRKDLIFLVQNIHSLTNLLGGLEGKELGLILELIFQDELATLREEARQNRVPGRYAVTITAPSFRIFRDLHNKEIVVTATINGMSTTTNIGQEQLFAEMFNTFGNTSIAQTSTRIE